MVLSKKDWDYLRKQVYIAADNKCEICGGVGKRHPVECHEVWEFDDTTYTQKLVRLIALCPDCHKVKHIGFAGLIGQFENAFKHFLQVNQLDRTTGQQELIKANKIFEERSKHEWVLDISALSQYDG